MGQLTKVKRLTKPNKLKFNVGGRLAKSLLNAAKQSVEEKVFKPIIKEYGSNTKMFTDFLKQAGEQGITPDRNSKLYKQIVDELPEARKYYQNFIPETITEPEFQAFKKHGTYLHGTTKELIGEQNKLLPPNITNKLAETGRNKNLDKIFFTDSEKIANDYAIRASKVLGGKPYTLKLIPSDVNLLTMISDIKSKGKHYPGKKPPAKNVKILYGSEGKIVNDDQIQQLGQTLTDEQLADGLYLSTKTEQAQKGLKDSKVKDLVYHGSGNDFDKFSKEAFFSGEGAMVHGSGFYTAANKQNAQYYADLASRSDNKQFQQSPELMKLRQEHSDHITETHKLRRKYYPESTTSKKAEIDLQRRLHNDFEKKNYSNFPPELIEAYSKSKRLFEPIQKLYQTELETVVRTPKTPKVLPLLISSKNPILTTDPDFKYISDETGKNSFAMTKYLSNKNIDSVIHSPGNEAHYIPYEPTQLKSLFREHLGKWDWDNSNIHKALIPLGVGVGLGTTQMKKGNKLKTKRLKTKYK
jgi:hypothetical protein